MKPIPIILSGLGAAQFIATLHVYASNQSLLRDQMLIRAEGFLPVPNMHVMAGLDTLAPAFWGGLFFTLTIGAFFTLAGFWAAWLFHRIGDRPSGRRIAGAILSVIWLSFFIPLNLKGASLYPSLYILTVPSLTFMLTLKGFSGRSRQFSGLSLISVLICMSVLGGAAVYRFNAGTFSHIRDNLLLSHRAGRAINNFYYAYTLYPAQAFKNLYQKQQRTCRVSLDASSSPRRRKKLERRLIRYQYLPVSTPDVPVDLELKTDENRLLFYHRGKPAHTVTESFFFSKTGSVLKTFALNCDGNAFFREITFHSLLAVSGIFLFAAFYLPFRLMAGLTVQKEYAPPAASVLCCVFGLLILFAWHPKEAAAVKTEEIMSHLTAPELPLRVAALKTVRYRKLEIADYHVHEKMAESPFFLERYWLAKALSRSKSEDTLKTAVKLLDDPEINVAYSAYHSLGRRKDPKAVPEILRRLKTSERWYVQMYAYNALKSLGWKQTKSASLP